VDFTYEHYVKSLHPDEVSSEFWLSERIYEDKLRKYEIAKKYNSKKIAEIGVRYGYSGYAFLSASEDSHYYGFELPIGNRRSGGVRGVDTIPWVRENFMSIFGKERISFYHINSQEILEYPTTFDLFHVDANHSYNGCFHDCVTGLYSLTPGGVLLVDDQDNGTVAKSTAGFLQMFTGNIKESYLNGTDYVIIKK